MFKLFNIPNFHQSPSYFKIRTYPKTGNDKPFKCFLTRTHLGIPFLF